MNSVHVSMLPLFLSREDLPRQTAIVIDILRASTTMIHALAAGADSVLPCLSVEDARQAAQRLTGQEYLLGGERGGQQIPGFDLDNSPLKYTPDRVRGKAVVFTTTNGTRALLECQAAKRVWIGGFVNLSAIVTAAKQVKGDIHLVCAGTDGQLTAEDILFAGAVVTELQQPGSGWNAGNVQAQMAADFYQARSRESEVFRETFFSSLGARNLQELGMSADIERSMQRDLFQIVPVWNAETGRITVS